MELETQTWIANEQGYFGEKGREELAQKIERMFALVSGLINAKRRAVAR